MEVFEIQKDRKKTTHYTKKIWPKLTSVYFIGCAGFEEALPLMQIKSRVKKSSPKKGELSVKEITAITIKSRPIVLYSRRSNLNVMDVNQRKALNIAKFRLDFE